MVSQGNFFNCPRKVGWNPLIILEGFLGTLGKEFRKASFTREKKRGFRVKKNWGEIF